MAVLSSRDPDATEIPPVKQAANKSSVVCLKRLCIAAAHDLCSQMWSTEAK